MTPEESSYIIIDCGRFRASPHAILGVRSAGWARSACRSLDLPNPQITEFERRPLGLQADEAFVGRQAARGMDTASDVLMLAVRPLITTYRGQALVSSLVDDN